MLFKELWSSGKPQLGTGSIAWRYDDRVKARQSFASLKDPTAQPEEKSEEERKTYE